MVSTRRIVSLSTITILLAGALVVASPRPAEAATETHVFVDVLEVEGRVDELPRTFDSKLLVTYTPPVGGQPLDIDVRIYDRGTGEPLRSMTDVAVCNPCEETLETPGTNRLAWFIENLIDTTGGMAPGTSTRLAVVVETTGNLAQYVSVEMQGISSRGAGPITKSSLPPVQLVGATDYLLPYFFERPGTVAAKKFTTDIVISGFYGGGLPGFGDEDTAEVEINLFNARGGALRSDSGKKVCAPCRFDYGTRGVYMSLDSMIRARGGFPNGKSVKGFGLLNVSGDPADLTVGAYRIDTLGHEFSRTETTINLERLPSPTFSEPNARAHFDESPKRVGQDRYGFDNRFIFATGAGRMGHPGGDATVRTWLFNNSGDPLKSDTGERVCAPCRRRLSEQKPTSVIDVDALIRRAGGFGGRRMSGFAIFRGSGNTVPVSIQGILEMGGTNLNERATTRLYPEPSGQRQARVLQYLREEDGKEIDTQINMTYAGGRAGIADTAEPNVQVFLIGDDGNALAGQNGAACDPCEFTLSKDAPKKILRIERAIEDAGGFQNGAVSGYAFIGVSGEGGEHVAISALKKSDVPNSRVFFNYSYFPVSL